MDTETSGQIFVSVDSTDGLFDAIQSPGSIITTCLLLFFGSAGADASAEGLPVTGVAIPVAASYLYMAQLGIRRLQ